MVGMLSFIRKNQDNLRQNDTEQQKEQKTEQSIEGTGQESLKEPPGKSEEDSRKKNWNSENQTAWNWNIGNRNTGNRNTGVFDKVKKSCCA